MHSNVVRGLLNPRTIASRALFSIISQNFTAERRVLHLCGWKMTCCTREPEFLLNSTSSALIHRWNISFKRLTRSIDRWQTFRRGFLTSFATAQHLSWPKCSFETKTKGFYMVILPDQSQSFRFFARSNYCCKLYEAAKQTFPASRGLSRRGKNSFLPRRERPLLAGKTNYVIIGPVWQRTKRWTIYTSSSRLT